MDTRLLHRLSADDFWTKEIVSNFLRMKEKFFSHMSFYSMVHVQNKIAVGMDVLKCFTMNNWDFKSDNYKNLIKKQSKEEYDMWVDKVVGLEK